MFNPSRRFVIWWMHDGITLCDHKTMMFFNGHALFSRNIYFIEVFNWQDLNALEFKEPHFFEFNHAL